MTFEIILNADDYLNQSLFLASKSKMIRNKKRRTLIILFGAFVMLALSSYLNEGPSSPWWAFLICGLIFVSLYPIYQRYLYKKHYKKIITNTYKNRFGKPVQVEFKDDELLTKDYSGESKIHLVQLEHIYEIGAYFLLKFETAEVLILPKNQIPMEDFNVILTQLIQKYNLPFSQELNWKFK